LLQAAITLHAGHMDGTVDTSDESQSEMMDMMVEAYTQICGMAPMVMSSDSMQSPRNADDEMAKALRAIAADIMADTIRRKVA
jgi:trimethylamine:corrinoid methyltransferase-like protein